MEPDLLGCHSKPSWWGGAAACFGPPDRSKRNHLRHTGTDSCSFCRPVAHTLEQTVFSAAPIYGCVIMSSSWLCTLQNSLRKNDPTTEHKSTAEGTFFHPCIADYKLLDEYMLTHADTSLDQQTRTAAVFWIKISAVTSASHIQFGSWELFDLLNTFCVVHRLEAFDLSLFFLSARVLFRTMEWLKLLWAPFWGVMICLNLQFWSKFEVFRVNPRWSAPCYLLFYILGCN